MNADIVKRDNSTAVIMPVHEVGESFVSAMSTVSDAVIFNASASPEKQLSEMIGKQIKITGFYVEAISFTKRDTGEVVTAPRVVLIDENNVSYGCVSLGIYHTLERMCKVFGTPGTWENPITVEVKQINRGERRIFTLYVV